MNLPQNPMGQIVSTEKRKLEVAILEGKIPLFDPL